MKTENEDDVIKILKHTLIKMGVRCDMIGFEYLCCAVKLVIERPELIHRLCNGLYVQVAKEFEGTKTGCVERSIRHIIETTYINRGFMSLNKMFKTDIYSINDKPTAGEFINLLAQYYNLGLYKEDNF